jgi:Protein of unknown function (DUF3575)
MARFKENDLPKSKITASSLNKAKIILFIFFTSLTNAQDIIGNDSAILDKKNEITINSFKYLIGCYNLNYERHLNECISLGISGEISPKQRFEYDYGGHNEYSVEPFLRYTFPKFSIKFCYIELFTSLNGGNITTTDRILDNNIGYYEKVKKKYTGLALGFSLGKKFYFSKNFCFDFYGGFGKYLYYDNKYNEVGGVVRIGLNIGYRF